ncbi:MAG TPA: glycosyltransferase [Flavisolibacter sp.]|nr:glycosyltransferase [Flavisolibacter sp.]
MSERKKILWLVSWYPNKYDPFDGDFIQRHARAASLYADIYVLFVKQAEGQQEAEEVCSENEGLTEQIIYLPKGQGLLAKYFNYRRWEAAHKIEIEKFVKRHPTQLIHVHVPWRVGLIALWANRKYGIPFMVTEHWGIYNNVVGDNIHTQPFYFRYLLKRIYERAAVFAPVSSYLAEGVNKTVVEKNYHVIPNTVDTSLFTFSAEKHSLFTFLHVSNMVPLKNVEGILNAFHLFLSETQAAAQLLLVGSGYKKYESMAQKSGLLGTSVFFRGEVSYGEVAKEMQRSHVLVVNSNAENSPCVIGEALCCGLPVIATRVGGIPELIGMADGILIQPGRSDLLATAMTNLYNSWDKYDRKLISDAAKAKFSFKSVGKILYELYDSN